MYLPDDTSVMPKPSGIVCPCRISPLIKTKAQLIARVEERYVLPHEVAAQDVEIWGLDRRF